MNVLVDEWTPFFDSLAGRLNTDARRKLLAQLIGDVYDVTILNFGEDGIARPSQWPSLTPAYAREKHEGNRTPTLILTGKLREGFRVEFDSESASLTNIEQYADDHQFGAVYKSLPARPFYPVDDSGLTFTPFMISRLEWILESHFQLSGA